MDAVVSIYFARAVVMNGFALVVADNADVDAYAAALVGIAHFVALTVFAAGNNIDTGAADAFVVLLEVSNV